MRFVSTEDPSDTTHAGSAGEAWIIRDGGNLEVHVPTCVNANIEVQAQRLNSVADYENCGNPFTVELDGVGGFFNGRDRGVAASDSPSPELE